MDWCDENSTYRKSTYGVSCCQLAEASQGGTMEAITFLRLAAVNYVAMGKALSPWQNNRSSVAPLSQLSFWWRP